MVEIIAKKSNWNLYTSSIGDYHPGHRDDGEAKKLGLERAIAPGMWLASHIETFIPRDYYLSALNLVKFSGRVYDGDRIEIINGENNFKFLRDGKRVCSINGLISEQYKESPRQFEAPIFGYETAVSQEDVREFNNSIGSKKDYLLDMHLASLSAPALLEYGRKRGQLGIHRGQSFVKHEDFEVGPTDVLIDREESKGDREGNTLYSFQLQWVQGGYVIASGKSTVVSSG